jgi:hypothetical protein
VIAVRINSRVGALYLGLVLTGCATTQQTTKPASERNEVPNPGAQLGAGCARIAIEGPLRGGLVVLPITTTGLRGDGTSVPDTGPVVIRQLSDAERSAFPQSWAGGCAWGSDCYSHPGANNGPVEMNRLTEAERSAFPRPFAAGGASGYGC